MIFNADRCIAYGRENLSRRGLVALVFSMTERPRCVRPHPQLTVRHIVRGHVNGIKLGPIEVRWRKPDLEGVAS